MIRQQIVKAIKHREQAWTWGWVMVVQWLWMLRADCTITPVVYVRTIQILCNLFTVATEWTDFLPNSSMDVIFFYEDGLFGLDGGNLSLNKFRLVCQFGLSERVSIIQFSTHKHRCGASTDRIATISATFHPQARSSVLSPAKHTRDSEKWRGHYSCPFHFTAFVIATCIGTLNGCYGGGQWGSRKI